MYLQKSDTTPALSWTKKVRLQQQSAAKSPFGELSGSLRRAGSCTGDRVIAKLFLTCELLARPNPKRTRGRNTHNDDDEEEEEEEEPLQNFAAMATAPKTLQEEQEEEEHNKTLSEDT